MLPYLYGTTGKSKGVMSNHGSLIVGILSKDDMGAGNNIYLCIIPIFHVFGLSIPFLALQLGIPWRMPKFNLGETLLTIECKRENSLPVSPPILVALNKSPTITK